MFEHQLIVGGVYRFTFKSEFERHGVCSSGDVTCLHLGNGIFRVEQISTLRDLSLAGIDLYTNFFKPLGFSIEEYQEYFSGKPKNTFEKVYVPREVTTQKTTTENVYDAENHSVVEVQRSEVGKHIELVESGVSRTKRQYFEELIYGSFPIYKLVDVVNPKDVLYAPEKAIKNMPEVSLYEYQNLSIAVDIGFYDHPENLDGVLYTLRQSLALYGIQPANIQAFSADSKWMNAEEYEQCKSIRVPGTLVTITPQNKDGYLGRIAIINGGLKQIVSGSATSDTEVDIDDLVSGSQVIDPRLLLARVPLTETVFDSSKQYYLQGEGYESTNRIYLKLVEGVDYAPGETIPHYVRTTDTSAVTGKQYYEKKTNGLFYPVDSSSPENNVAMAKKLLSNGVKVYRYQQTTVAVGDNPPSTSEGYEEVDSAYVEDSNHLDLYFEKVADEFFSPIANPGNADPSVADGGWYETQPVYVVDYSAEAAVSLLTKKFKYLNRYNMITTTELNPESLATLINDVSDPVMITNSIVRRKYNDRWFEFTRLVKVPRGTIARGCNYYVEQSEPEEGVEAFKFAYLQDGVHQISTFVVDPGISETSVINDDSHWREETVCVIVNSATFTKPDDASLRKVKGVIVGEYGDSYKEVVIKDDTLNKNYYALYIAQLAESARIAEENVRLKELIARLSSNQNP